MKLSEELINQILKELDEYPHNFIMISDLAEKLEHWDSDEGLTNEFTNHLLHLQDLECFVNSNGESTFGHQASQKSDCEEKFTHHFHDQLIRINAHGRELFDVLENDTISQKGKSSALRIGGQVVTSMLVNALSGA
jgi:hypothetical protein